MLTAEEHGVFRWSRPAKMLNSCLDRHCSMRKSFVILLALVSACQSGEEHSVSDTNDCQIVPRLMEHADTGDRVLMTFQRRCRGDTHTTMNVSLIHGTIWSDGPGNILVIERPVIKSANEYPMAFATFSDSGGIDVDYDEDSRVVSKDTLVEGLHVRFSFIDNGAPRPKAAPVANRRGK